MERGCGIACFVGSVDPTERLDVLAPVRSTALEVRNLINQTLLYVCAASTKGDDA